MYNKNLQAINNSSAMNTDQTTLEWGANNVCKGTVKLSMVNFNLKDFHRRLYPDFVRSVISDGRVYCSSFFYCIHQDNSACKLLAIDLPFKERQRVSMECVSRLFADHVMIFSALYYLVATLWALYFAGWKVELPCWNTNGCRHALLCFIKSRR